MEKHGIDWRYRQVTSLNLNYFWLKGSKVNILMKRVCLELESENVWCGAACPKLQCRPTSVHTAWKMTRGFRKPTWEGTAFDYVEIELLIWDDKVCRKECLSTNPKLTRKQDLRAQSHRVGGDRIEFPTLATCKFSYYFCLFSVLRLFKSYIYIHIYIHIYVCMYTHTHIHIHTHTYIHIHIYIYIIYTYTHIYTYRHTHRHTHTHTHTYIYMYICICIYNHMYIWFKQPKTLNKQK